MSTKPASSFLIPTALDPSDISQTSKKTAFQGFGTLYEYIVRHRKFDGDWTGEVKREVYDTGDAIVVLPYNPLTDHVVLIEQFRITGHHTKRSPWLIECIAGRLEKNEAPTQTARREAQEEAGLDLLELIPINGMFMSPGVYAEYTTMFCGIIDSISDVEIHGLDEEHEDIRVLNIPFSAALDALDQGRIQTAPAQVCLNWLYRHRDQIRADHAQA